jgi:sulfate transport system permease protein
MRTIKARLPLHWLLIGIVAIYAVILVGIPVLAMVQAAFGKGIEALANALLAPDVVHAFGITLLLAAGAGVINLIFGLLLAWVLVRHEFPGKRLLAALVDAPFVISPVIIGSVLIVLFGRNGWLNIPNVQIAFAVPGMLLATIIVSMPFVTREVIPVLVALRPEQEEAAYTFGAGRWYTFRRVILPELRWALIYGLLLTISRALGEFGAVIVIGGAIQGLTESATVYVFRALDDRNAIGAYGASILLALLSVGLLTLMETLNRRHQTPVQSTTENMD